MLLKPKEYYLCDDKDYNKKFGIIAQDVEIDFPELIFTDKEYIANIYSYATYVARSGGRCLLCRERGEI